MSAVTLLAPPTAAHLPMWQFDHAVAHRELLGAMSLPITSAPLSGGLARFSAIPYFIDPQTNASFWHLEHGQASNDAAVTLPGYFGGTTGIINPPTDFVDMNFANAELLSWWAFANHQFHMTAQGVLPAELTFPFW